MRVTLHSNFGKENMIYKLFLVSSALFLTSACGVSNLSKFKERWNPANDPINMAGDYVIKFDQLPLQSALPTQPWSDTYWPSYRGGVAQRWRSHENGHQYTTLPEASLASMTLAEISKLSPAEKYDIYIGNFGYGLVGYERSRTTPQDDTWFGLCHGWAPASLIFAEPKSVLVTSRTGIQIPFAASDVKALLTLHQGNFNTSKSTMLGERCNTDISNLPLNQIPVECRDTNAGAFHVVIANQIALKQKGFVADVTRDLEVWNQPVYSYQTEVIGETTPSLGSAVGTEKELIVKTTMVYGVEISPQWDHVVATGRNSLSSEEYQYRLELDGNNNILGGAWLTEDSSRPDFLWSQDAGQLNDYFLPLKDLYEASLASPGIVDPAQQ
jgi:hypothetical protein